jgi:hypothetical protein
MAIARSCGGENGECSRAPKSGDPEIVHLSGLGEEGPNCKPTLNLHVADRGLGMTGF